MNKKFKDKEYNIVGLTGIIGSGKSVVAGYFAELGIDIIDTDKIAHRLVDVDGEAIEIIKDKFGNAVFLANGEFDRNKMRQLVFNDKAIKAELEAILHPLIYQEVIKQIENSSSFYVIVVVPLLFKTPEYLDLIMRSIFVDCSSEALLIERVQLRSDMTEDMIRLIIASHVDRKTQFRLANDIIFNGANVNLYELKIQVMKLDQYYNICL